MWPFTKRVYSDLRFTNTLSGAKEPFKPITPGRVLLYSCGPTVYGPVQIGNLRSFVLGDLVARTLVLAGYKVKRVMNITDVGHMVGDAEQGEDKMAAGAKREATTPEAVAKRYTDLFMEDIRTLNIETASIAFPKATDYIAEDIAMIRTLTEKGFTYQTEDGIYFNTEKFPEYGMLGGMKHAEQRAGARVEQGSKRSAHDFVLWRTAKPHDLQKWNSPWGEGNPGWSIECSAMATALLGSNIDIHTGGEDLASIHHNNEIAQSESASGQRPFVKYWLHGAFLTMGGEKLSKSAGNSFTLKDVIERGFHPLALRYLFLQAHYRTPLSFSWEALEAANDGLMRLYKEARALKQKTGNAFTESSASRAIRAHFFDDLKTPQALAELFEALGNSDLGAKEKWGALLVAESVLGLSLVHPPETLAQSMAIDELPADIRTVAARREEARKNRDFAASDELRIHLAERGYAVEDGPSGSAYTKIER